MVQPYELKRGHGSKGVGLETKRAKTQGPQSPVRQRFLRELLGVVHRTIRDVWFYIAALLLVLNVYNTFSPHLSIQASTTANNNPLDTLFTLTNNGPLSLYKVEMTCKIWNGQRLLITLTNVSFSTANWPARGNPDVD